MISDPLPIDYLPNSIKELLKILDTTSVYKLIAEYGGTRIIIPVSLDTDHELASLLGFAEFSLLIGVYQGETMTIPRCIQAINRVRNQALLADRRAGLSLAQLARKYSLTERGVSKALRWVEREEYFQRVKHLQLDWLEI